MIETPRPTVPVTMLSDDLAFLDIVTEWDTSANYHQWKPSIVVPATFRPSPEQMRYVITVANQKGGVGKTLTAFELALSLVARGLRVRLIDADPQVASLTLWLPVIYPEGLPEDQRRSLRDVYYDQCTLAEATYPTPYQGLYLVPSFPDLDQVQNERPTGYETCLRWHLRECDDDFDVTIIDSGPSLGALTVSALVAAHDVVIPVQAASGLDVEGAASLYQTIDTVTNRMNRDLRVAAIFLTDFEKSKLARTIGGEMAKAFPDALIVPTRTCVKIGSAQLEKKALREFAPDATTVLDYDRGAGILVGRASL
ncbi:ParA family protein [Streptomyces sp. NPDC051173]|uniref:ParA family protein n=1 Tax=Streptomyces sp. NPDC051173 TaxID=3155164 RepID=UPI00344B6A18